VGIVWLSRRLNQKRQDDIPVEKISRSQFLAKTAIVAGALPFSSSVFGILSGAGDYRVRRQTITLKNLPRQFDGIRIGQISDIHAGTYYNMTEVKGGVDLFMAEKADVIFFTGDLVNTRTSEVNPSISIHSKIKAPLGVFSVTGNHDYGNYAIWTDDLAKQKNFEDMLQAHKVLGYDMLMNEHRILKVDGEQLAVLGVENWGLGPPQRFPQYGKLDLAFKGTEEIPVKLLLSHDPSHWDAQVRPMYPSIDVTFAGHTHGFQIGIEVPGFRWSPAQYKFKQWAGLYQTGDQYIYVNRGFGCIGYPGRIGIPPELTIIELKRA
jgi:predicted MPP superfamily phosphohydrolase